MLIKDLIEQLKLAEQDNGNAHVFTKDENGQLKLVDFVTFNKIDNDFYYEVV